MTLSTKTKEKQVNRIAFGQKNQHILHSFDFQQKNHLNGQLIVIKFQKWGYGTSRPLNIADSNRKTCINTQWSNNLQDHVAKKLRLHKIAMKNLYDYLESLKIIHLLTRNKQNWLLNF